MRHKASRFVLHTFNPKPYAFNLKTNMKLIDKILNHKLWWLWLALVFMLVIYAASSTHFRIDLTKEKRFSLSQSTKNVLKNLDDEVQIDVYLTGDLSAGFKVEGVGFRVEGM